MLLKKAILVFDDMDLEFNVIMEGTASQERLKNGNFIYTVNLKSDYAKGATEIYTNNTAATDAFKLTVVYYTNNTKLVGTETVTIKASDFVTGKNPTWASLGIELNKYQPTYYNPGTLTNFQGQALTYENLYNLQVLFVNYSPTIYTKEVEYYLFTGQVYELIESSFVSFTKAEADAAKTIGQLVDFSKNKPNGYMATTSFNLDFSFENVLAFKTAIGIYFKQADSAIKTKDITLKYVAEGYDNAYEPVYTQTVAISEDNVVDGTTLNKLFNLNGQKPDKYYRDGYISNATGENVITFDELLPEYEIKYDLIESNVYIEYYLGTYPSWNRTKSELSKFKHHPEYDQAADLFEALGIDKNKYKRELYEDGLVFNAGIYDNYDSVINAGVIQIYYPAKEYQIEVKYFKDNDGELELLGSKEYTINDTLFLSEPTLPQLIEVNAFRPDGFTFDEKQSYKSELSVQALTQASPINVVYKAVDVLRTKSIVIKYKQELASAYSTINTSIMTIEESAVGGGIKLKDLFDINKHRPEYYDEGIVDGYSGEAFVTFEEIQGVYEVIYFASSYTTQVRYYTDDISNGNWIGSDRISYRVLDFTTETTLVSLGVNVNLFKPGYCEDGQIRYTGPINFAALIGLDAIDIVYMSKEEPGEDDGIDYPHRILFLQHNDMGSYDSQFPGWTLNHAYINTGVTCDDMSKLTVLCSTVRVFETEPLYNVNVGDAYLFGSVTPNGSYYIKYTNNTKFLSSTITGNNTYTAMAGYYTPMLIIDEDAQNGFSRNTGITSSEREGYSYATLTYTSLLQSNSAKMTVPLYLFACDYNGHYQDGIAGVGITGCKIYYDNVLIRDYVPVQFYDKIGSKVAPSNCLYDKVSQNFFEDGRKLESFNIIDDPEYEDNNPAHKIGKCYAQYYKDDKFFQTRTIYFRGDEFINNGWNPEEKLGVDEYQPEFYGSGKIVNLPELGGITFNNVNNFVFQVSYPSTGYKFTVNYWKDNKDNPNNLIAAETVELTEDMFYSVPTFGQIVDLDLHKPASYKANWDYPETKVTFKRILAHVPYDIIYTNVENPKLYSFTVKYYRKQFGINIKEPLRTYQYLGEKVITIDETQIMDGVYPEEFMNFNLFKPEKFYKDGTSFEWYTEDENLIDPSYLRDEYIIVYETEPQYIPVNYYTDEVAEENLIASDTWEVNISDWHFGEEFQIADEIPNDYINRFKPIICDGGILQDSEKWYTFDTLAESELSIVYMTREEPHDPDDDSFPSKIIWFTQDDPKGTGDPEKEKWIYQHWNTQDGLHLDNHLTADVPYLNLGYTPKEIGRLKMEIKGYSLGYPEYTALPDWAHVETGFSYYAGYFGPNDTYSMLDSMVKRKSEWGEDDTKDGFYQTGVGMNSKYWSKYSPNATGWFAFKGRNPSAQGFNRRFDFFAATDQGEACKWSNEAQCFVIDSTTAHTEFTKRGEFGYRLGKYSTYDEELEPFKENNDHIFYDQWRDYQGHRAKSWSNGQLDVWKCHDPALIKKDVTHDRQACVFHPYTMILDAYNGYAEIYDISNYNDPYYWNIPKTDQDLFVDRCKPRGPITLFLTTNPDTGKVNMLLDDSYGLPFMVNYDDIVMGTTSSGGNGGGVDTGTGGNGGTGSGSTGGTSGTGSGTGGGSGTQTGGLGQEIEIHGGYLNGMAYNPYKHDINCPWGNAKYTLWPALLRTAIWHTKIWDRDRLVRDLIPVEKGDKIYDYIAPDNGMFDKVTEIFFTNANKGGTYEYVQWGAYEHPGDEQWILRNPKELTIEPEEVGKFQVALDPTLYGKITVNYFNENNEFLGNQYADIPTDYFPENIAFKDILKYNDYKPSLFYHDGMIDTDIANIDADVPFRETLEEVYNKGSINVYYKQQQYAKTVVYYRGNTRIASKDFFFSQNEIEEAHSLADLGIDPQLYATDDFKPGRVMSDETIIAGDDVAAFIDAPSPVVVYDKWSKEERPDLFYFEYYRGGAYEPEGAESITVNSDNLNYLDCDLTAKVLNSKGCIKYLNHYHSALYEDEKMPYFIAYQVDVKANYVNIHKGPARAYKYLATITDRGRYTIIEESQNGKWGRLKEYPKGWILLSYTEPATGPGQNPDFDVPDAENAVTIPFATELSVTKMTIDRLWAYTPEFGSWIKTEEISFNQSGRLYNGLALGVLHLDKIDWSKVNTLDDLGLDPNKYALRFHERCDWAPAAIDQATFSELHSIDLVYPETIYPYTVKYYKDLVDEDHIVGTGAFSCSLSDWNPDWDKFIETSWRTVEGYPAFSKTVNYSFYKDTEKAEKIDTIPLEDICYVLNKTPITNEKGNKVYQVFYKEQLGYITANEDLTISDNLSTAVISPIIYRDTPIRLTWDFYGLNRNLYKPDSSYNDGIFMWNPRTYENKEVTFNFEELITTGKQEILYTESLDTDWKADFGRGWISLPIGVKDFYFIPVNEKPGLWDIEIKWQNLPYEFKYSWDNGANAYNYYAEQRAYNNNIGIASSTSNTIAPYQMPSNTSSYSDEFMVRDDGFFARTRLGNKLYISDEYQHREGAVISYGHVDYYSSDQKPPKANDYNVTNFSNKRHPSQATISYYGNDFAKTQTEYLFSKREIDVLGVNKGEYSHYNDKFDAEYLNIGAGYPVQQETVGGTSFTYTKPGTTESQHRVFYYVKVWKDFYLQHYYVPLPKGYRLPNGTQIQYNTFYDLITKTIADKPTFSRNVTVYSGSEMLYPDIYRLGKDTTIDTPADFFEGWSFNSTFVNYVGKILTNKTIVYKDPDVLSIQLKTLQNDMVVPINRVTSDEANYVKGTWYHINSGWIQATDVELLPNDTLDGLEEKTGIVALKGDQSNNAVTYYGYLEPNEEKVSNYNKFTTETILNIYYKCGDFYWVGDQWIPISYTDHYINELEQETTYIVSVTSLDVMKYPITDLARTYRVYNVLSGERITAVASLGKDADWLKLKDGNWIYRNNNLTELE